MIWLDFIIGTLALGIPIAMGLFLNKPEFGVVVAFGALTRNY